MISTALLTRIARAAAGLTVVLALVAARAQAQTGADSTRASSAPTESFGIYRPSTTRTDSVAAESVATDSVAADSAGAASAIGDRAADDSAADSSTTAEPAPNGSTAASSDPATTDTTLTRACAGAEPGSEAPGLLAVNFRPGTPDKARADAARAVGGTLAGPNEYGEEYVILSPDAGPLPAVADRLIRQDPVTRVSPLPCPGPIATETPDSASASSRPGAGAAGDSTPLAPAVVR